MIKHLFLLTLLFIGVSSFEQTYSVKGYLESEQKAVPFATVFVKSISDSSIVKVGLADSTGIFSVSGVPNGSYFLTASMVGMADLTPKDFEVSGSNVDLGVLEMSMDTELMNEVTIMKIRPVIEVQPDRTVFNVENTINATGSSGFDLLRKAPGVIIDNSNNIIVEGKSGVMIFIDNKPSPLAGEDLINFLQSLQASQIDKIEIITQPSSKYDAAGNAGIINIVLKRDKRMGTNGTLSAGYGRGFSGTYGDNNRFNGSASINHRNKISTIYASYSTSAGARGNFFDFDRLQQGYYFDSYTEGLNDIKSHNGRIGADFLLGKKHTIGILASGNFFDIDGLGNSETEITPENGTVPEQILIANNTTLESNYQLTGNINYRFEDTLGHELTIDGDYGVYNRESESIQPNEYYDALGNLLFANNYRMLSPTDIEIITGQVDYAQNLFKGKFGIGAKYSLVNTDNYFDFFNSTPTGDSLDEDRSNDFFYKENIIAGYLNYGRQLGPKWNFQIGLRGENTISKGELVSTQSNGEVVDTSYFNLFPSGGVTYMASQKHMWRLNFSRRIQRPNYQTLNPFEQQVSELSFQKGNPFLRPQLVWTSSISHTFKYRFTTSLSYSYAEGFFAQITDTLGTNKTFLISRNVADNQVISLNVSLPLQLKPWWSVFVNINAFNSSFFARDDKFQPIDQTTLSLYGQNTFILPAGFKLEISGWFSSPSIWGGTYRTKSLGSLDAAVEKRLLNDNLSIRLAISDILFTAPWRADLKYGDLEIEGSGGWESRALRFQVTYNFGNQNVKTRKRKTGLDDLEKRTGGDSGAGGS